jgi:transaldolase
MPMETLDANRDHGNPAERIEENMDHAYMVLDSMGNFAIELEEVSRRLEDEGIEKFNKPFDELLQTLDRRISEIQHGMYAGTGF